MRKTLTKFSILVVIISLSACNLFQKTTSEGSVIEDNRALETQSQISQTSIQQKLEYLASDELLGRETGTVGIEKAAVFIEDIFRKNNLKPYFKTYRDSFEVKGRTGYNMVGYLEGSDPKLKEEFIIMGAHYDHIGIGKTVDGDSIANGANDNAAGTVAVLELARHFAAAKTNKRSLMFILFSAEEMGLEGAKHIASRLKKENLNLYTMVNFEMIGIPMENKEHLAYLTGFELSNMAKKFNEYSNAEVLGFLPQAKEYNLFQRSDNYSFYQEFKLPAQTISTFDFTNYDYYHHVADDADKMDYAHMTNLIKSVIPGLTAMANTPQKEIKMN